MAEEKAVAAKKPKKKGCLIALIAVAAFFVLIGICVSLSDGGQETQSGGKTPVELGGYLEMSEAELAEKLGVAENEFGMYPSEDDLIFICSDGKVYSIALTADDAEAYTLFGMAVGDDVSGAKDKLSAQFDFALSYDVEGGKRDAYQNKETGYMLGVDYDASGKIISLGYVAESGDAPTGTDGEGAVSIAPPAGVTFMDIATDGSQRYIYFDSSEDAQITVTMRYDEGGELIEETTATLGSPSNTDETTTWRDENGRFTFDVTDFGEKIFVTDTEKIFQTEYRFWKDVDGTEHPESFMIEEPEGAVEFISDDEMEAFVRDTSNYGRTVQFTAEYSYASTYNGADAVSVNKWMGNTPIFLLVVGTPSDVLISGDTVLVTGTYVEYNGNAFVFKGESITKQ